MSRRNGARERLWGTPARRPLQPRPASGPRVTPSSLRIALAAYVASLPFVWPTLVTLGAKRLVIADIGFAGVLAVAFLRGPGVWRRPRLDLLALAVLPVIAVAASAVQSGGGFEHVVRLAYSMLVLVTLAHLRIEREVLPSLSHVWIGVAVSVTLLGAVFLFGAIVSGSRPSGLTESVGTLFPRLSSVLKANALVPYLGLTIAVAAFLAGREGADTRRRRVLLALWGFLALAACFAFSRGIAGMWITIALLAAVGGMRLGVWGRCWRWTVLIAVLAVFAAGAVSIWAVLPSETEARRAPLSSWHADFERKSAYLILNTAAYRMWRDHPWLGVGPAEFGRHLTDATTPSERAGAWPQLVQGRDWDPHSMWAGWAARTGTLGVATLLGLFMWILRDLWNARHSLPLSFPGTAAAALVGVIVNGLHVDLLHLKYIWVYLGLALSQTAQDPDP